MAAKLAGFAWVVAMATGFMAAGCQEPQKSAARESTAAPTSAAAAQQEPADPAVSVLGLSVKAAQYDESMKLFRNARDYSTSDRSTPSIDVILHVATEKYDFVSVDRAVVESLTDKSGHDLSLGMTQTTDRLFFPAEANISLDRKHGFIALHFLRPPAADTRQLVMRGTVLARSGGREQTLTFENVPFSIGSKFKVLGHDYMLNNIWSYDSQPDQVNFSFTSDGSYDEVRAIRFLSDDGKKMVGTIWRVDRFVRQPTSLLCRVNGEKPQTMRIEVDTYEKPMELAIPFQLNLDLGAVSFGEPMKLVTTASLPATPAEERIKSDSQVIALSMSAAISEQQSKEWFGQRSSVSAFRRAGLNLQVKVHVGDRKMVRLAPAPGTVLAFTDDTGSSLLATASISGSPDQGGMREMTMIGRDGHDALLTVTSGKLPAPGARELRFKGKVGVIMEESEKVDEIRGVTLMPGTSFKAGDVEMSVTSVSAAGAAGNGMNLVMTAERAIHGIVALLDENGKLLASTAIGEDPYGRRMEKSQVMFTLPKAVDTATVQVKTTADADAISVPVEFMVPVGLGGQK